MPNPQVSLGAARQSTPLSPTSNLLSTDALYQTILQVAQGGNSTGDYFGQVNAVAQIYKTIGNRGGDAWNTSTDSQGHPVYYVNERDSSGKTYYATIALQGLKLDNENITHNGNTWTVNGVTYTGVVTAVKTIGYSNMKLSEISWDIGVAAAGTIPPKIFMPLILNCLKSVATVVGNAIRSAFRSLVAGGEALQQSKIELQRLGEQEISQTGEVAVADTAADATATAIAGGIEFIGAAVAVAVVFIALSFVLHNSYHNLRLWNLTKYDLDWTYVFISEAGSNEGQFSSAPLDQKTNVPITIKGATRASGIPGVAGPPSVQYADFNVASSHEYNGIGWAIQINLKDPATNTIVYTTTVYYDIPFEGVNSTNLTFDPVPDLATW